MANPYAGLVGSHVMVTTITKEDILACNIKPALASLNKLVASKQALVASNGTISLMVSGYDDDPRELHVIPEVRTYFRALDERFPYWFHVCTRIEHSLRMLFMMMVELTPVFDPGQPGGQGMRFANDDLHLFLSQHLDAMNGLHARHGFDEKESAKIGELVMSYFEAVIAK